MFDFLLENAVIFKNEKDFLSSEQDNIDKNIFIKVCSEDILKLENIVKIPDELKLLWQEIGMGLINYSTNGLIFSECNNQILSPHSVKNILLGVTDSRPDFEIENDTIPFFEVIPASFLCMRLNHDDKGVYWMWGGRVADSLVDFFKLLLKNPNGISWVS